MNHRKHDRTFSRRAGEQIRRLREDMGIPQWEIAKRLGLSQASVSYWERGACEPSLEFLIRLADVFNVTIDELVGRTRA